MTVSAQHQLRRHLFDGVPAPLDDKGEPVPRYIALFSGQRKRDGSALHSTTSRYFKWPEQSDGATRWIQSETQRGRETYQCAHLLTGKRRVKPNAAQMIALYVDGDGAQPGPEFPQPTATIESSPGRQQFYWRLTRPIDPTIGEQLNRRLANAMQADMSGWDLTQLLRPPETHNWKYDNGPTVKLISIEGQAYDPDELDRILPPLPVETGARTEVKLERRAAAALVGDRDQRAIERMYAGKRGGEIQALANGGSISGDASGDDQSYFNGLAFWLDKDASRMAAVALRSGRVRDKWDEVHYADGRTYLEGTIGKAIDACSQTFRDLTGYDAGDQPVHIQISPPAPVVETPSAECPCNGEHAQCSEIRELRESNRDLLAWVERLAGTVEDLQACNATLSTKLSRIQEEREIDRRTELAKGRVRRAFKAGQADAIIAVATIAPPIANTWKTDEPIITRAMVAEANGVHVATAGENLKVFDLDGSPIKRIQKSLGPKDLTAYKLDGLTAPDILEQMADLGERLKDQDGARPTTRAKRVRCERCPEGTPQTLAIICDGCGGLLQKRHAQNPPADNASETRALEPTPAPVDVLRTTGTRFADVAVPLPLEETGNVVPIHPHDMPADQVCQRHGIPRLKSGRCSMCEALPSPPVTPRPSTKRWRCRCGSLEGHSVRSGLGWRCDGCGCETAPVAAVAGGSE